METSRLSREAIFEKLRPHKKEKKNDIKSSSDIPANLEKQDYDEIELDNLEDK